MQHRFRKLAGLAAGFAHVHYLVEQRADFSSGAQEGAYHLLASLQPERTVEVHERIGAPSPGRQTLGRPKGKLKLAQAESRIARALDERQDVVGVADASRGIVHGSAHGQASQLEVDITPADARLEAPCRRIRLGNISHHQRNLGLPDIHEQVDAARHACRAHLQRRLRYQVESLGVLPHRRIVMGALGLGLVEHIHVAGCRYDTVSALDALARLFQPIHLHAQIPLGSKQRPVRDNGIGTFGKRLLAQLERFLNSPWAMRKEMMPIRHMAR